MKKSILFVLFVLFTFASYAQSKLPLVGVTRDLLSGDTIRTFSLVNTDHDKSIQKLLKLWGEPVKNTPGNISWHKISLPKVGNDLTIELYDGILMLIPNKGQMFKTFKDEADKADRIKKMTSDDHRITDIIIFNSARKQIVTSQVLEDEVVQYLEKNLK